MQRLSKSADVLDLDTENGEYLELHGGRRGAGGTLVREKGRARPEAPAPCGPEDDDGSLLAHLRLDDYWGYNNDHNYGSASLTLTLRGDRPVYAYYWHYANDNGYSPSFDILDSGDVSVKNNPNFTWYKELSKRAGNVC